MHSRRLARWRFALATLALAGAVPAQPTAPPEAVKPAGRELTLALGGLLQVQSEIGDRGDSRFANDNDRVYLRRARLNATGKFLEEFDFRIEADLAGSLSNTSSLRAQMTDGYITWTKHPTAVVRMGQFKTPFGFEQLFSDPRLITMERSLVNDRLTASRQLGVQVAGDLLGKRLSYAVGAFNGNGANNNFNDDDRFLVAGRLSGTPWQGKALGETASLGLGANVLSSDDTAVAMGSEFAFDSTPATPERDNVFAGERLATGVDAQLRIGRFDLWIEVLNTRFEPDSARPRARLDADGAYVQASYMALPDRLQLALKAETFDPRDDRDRDETDTLTLGAAWFFKGHDVKLMLNVLRSDVPGIEESQTKALVRLQTIF